MKPLVILDQHPRKLEELFSPEDYERLASRFELVGGQNWPLDQARLAQHLPDAFALVGSEPVLGLAELAAAPRLKAVIEVLGRFPATIDYAACASRNVAALSCAPGFRQSVAEMGLGLILACARGIVTEHERFRTGTERWLFDDARWDFSLYRQQIGFVGYGSIAREMSGLLSPFAPQIAAYDPWLSKSGADTGDVALASLADILTTSRCIVITASPTDENRGLIGAEEIAAMAPGTSVVLLSRAHLVDFDALLAAVRENRIRLATDVFPLEPVPDDHPVRNLRNLILSPHRAAAVPGGRHLIGKMIVDDLDLIRDGGQAQHLQPVNLETIEKRLGALRS